MKETDIAPFPYPLGLGTDICHIPRIRRILTNETPGHVDRFARRIFSAAEHRDFDSRYQMLLQSTQNAADGLTSSGTDSLMQDRYQRELWKLSSWLAGRFAAKEAAMKALSPRRIKWHQAEVLLLPGQKKPLLVIHDAPSTGTDDAAHEQNIRKRAAQLSISHDGEYAIATVVAITAAPVPCE